MGCNKDKIGVKQEAVPTYRLYVTYDYHYSSILSSLPRADK